VASASNDKVERVVVKAISKTLAIMRKVSNSNLEKAREMTRAKFFNDAWAVHKSPAWFHAMF
jgi:hypothetical protein